MITYVTSTNDNYFFFSKNLDHFSIFILILSWKKEVHLAEIKKENLRGVIKENVTNVDCGVLMGIFHS